MASDTVPSRRTSRLDPEQNGEGSDTSSLSPAPALDDSPENRPPPVLPSRPNRRSKKARVVPGPSDTSNANNDPPIKRGAGAPRGRRRPKRIPITFSTLPLEIMQHVAKFLLDPGPPPSHHPDNPLIAPDEYRYVSPRSLTYPAGQPERYGAIPGGVRDVVSLSRTCRVGHQACDKIFTEMGGFGKGTNWDDKISPEAIERLEIKQNLYIGLTEGTVTARERLREILMASKERVRKIVIHGCTHHNSKSSEDETSLKFMRPLQDDLEEPTVEDRSADTLPTPEPEQDTNNPAFPQLRDLQLGPELCRECSISLASLFFKTSFARTITETSTKWNMARAGWPESQATDTKNVRFRHPAAPNIKSLTIHLPDPSPFFSIASYHQDRPQALLDAIFDRIDATKLQGLQTLSLWISSQKREWMGFGMSGYSSCVKTKKVPEVEKELNKAVESERKARDAILKAALAKELAARKASSSTLKTAETKAQREQKLLDKFKLNAKIALRGVNTALGPDSAKIQIPTQEAPGSSNDSIASSTHVESAVPPSTHTSDRLPLADSLSPPPTLSPSLSEFDDIAPSWYGQESDDGYSDSDDESSHRMTRLPPRRRTYQNESANRRYSRDRAYQDLLGMVATRWPDLLALQVLRRGQTRNDIVEGVRSLDDYANTYARPLRNMKKLKWLDLGLAVVGKKEVEDFPLGFEVVRKASTRKSGELNDSALESINKTRRLIWDKRVDTAAREGNEWRQRVLEHFINGSRWDRNTSEDSEDGNDKTAEKAPHGWPRTVESGHFYSVDLDKRIKRHGTVHEWTSAVSSPMSKQKKSQNREFTFKQPREVLL